MPSELFELKVIVEADGWHDVAELMDTVDRALDPHRRARGGTRRWSVVANRLPGATGAELLAVVTDGEDAAAPGRLTA
ncbi:MAG TPA: hypothetical protein VFZ70_04365 [Euzebyales bacterium]